MRFIRGQSGNNCAARGLHIRISEAAGRKYKITIRSVADANTVGPHPLDVRYTRDGARAKAGAVVVKRILYAAPRNVAF